MIKDSEKSCTLWWRHLSTLSTGEKIRGPGCPITRCVTCGVRWKSTNIQSLKTWRKDTGISGGQTPWSILRSSVRVNMTARFLPGSLRRLFCSWSSRVRRSVILIILYEVKWSLLVNHRIRTDLIGCSPLLWVSVAVLQHHTVYYSVSVICEPQHTIYIKKKNTQRTTDQECYITQRSCGFNLMTTYTLLLPYMLKSGMSASYLYKKRKVLSKLYVCVKCVKCSFHLHNMEEDTQWLWFLEMASDQNWPNMYRTCSGNVQVSFRKTISGIFWQRVIQNNNNNNNRKYQEWTCFLFPSGEKF